MPCGRNSQLALSVNSATNNELTISITFDHCGPTGNSSKANHTSTTDNQIRDSRTWVKRNTPTRKNQCATTSKPLANQIPISNKPMPRSKARVEPIVMVAKPALQNSSDGSRTLRHSIARYNAAAAARAIEIVSIVGGSSAMNGLAYLVDEEKARLYALVMTFQRSLTPPACK
ncbi:hypothetical protein D3C75_779880 [compost metagenome]